MMKSTDDVVTNLIESKELLSMETPYYADLIL